MDGVTDPLREFTFTKVYAYEIFFAVAAIVLSAIGAAVLAGFLIWIELK